MSCRRLNQTYFAFVWAAAILVASPRMALGQDGGFGAQASAPQAEQQVQDEAGSTVGRAQLEERLPRSAPDALRFEPGVSVQQTAHGQASPYVRGMTGQQVVHLFDGVRLNNGIFRQGPNQYFFTVDALTLRRVEVLRGSASVRHGADALGGAIRAYPLRPVARRAKAPWWAPRGAVYYGTVDDELGGRVQLEAGWGEGTTLLLGGGYRDVGRLKSGGEIQTARPAAERVPRTLRDGTMLGTGFREATFDARLETQLGGGLRWVNALYGYRQMDAPRADKCPAPEAPVSECLRYDPQFRVLAYSALRGRAGKAARQLDVTLSYQAHRENLVLDRAQSSGTRIENENRVDTLGLAMSATTQAAALWGASVDLSYGMDAYQDRVGSRARFRTTDLPAELAIDRPVRGTYLDHSRYLTSGLFAELRSVWSSRWTLRVGGRGLYAAVRAPADAASGSRRVNERWLTAVASAGVRLQVHTNLAVLLNYDQGLRPPNLDDLTARTQTGPGFQFENSDLGPERTHSAELGMQWRTPWLQLDVWGFATRLEDAIQRAVRDQGDCPPETPACASSRSLFQLVNLRGRSRLFGAEGGATLFLPQRVTLRAVLNYAWGQGPRDPGGESDAEAPLSRVPPLNGSLEGRYRHLRSGVFGAAVVRWAAKQDRLSVSDASDPRLVLQGTPAYGVVDLRVGVRFRDKLRVVAVAENVLDQAYRIHGSSIDGPGRGVRLMASAGW